jgi:hypothetical protein
MKISKVEFSKEKEVRILQIENTNLSKEKIQNQHQTSLTTYSLYVMFKMNN